MNQEKENIEDIEGLPLPFYFLHKTLISEVPHTNDKFIKVEFYQTDKVIPETHYKPLSKTIDWKKLNKDV